MYWMWEIEALLGPPSARREAQAAGLHQGSYGVAASACKESQGDIR